MDQYFSIVNELMECKSIQETLQRERKRSECLNSTITDLSDMHGQMFMAYVNSDLLLYSTVDAIPIPMYIKNSDFKYELVSKPYSKFHGRSSREFIGRTDYDLYSKEKADILRDQDKEVFEKGISLLTPPISLTDANGSTHIIQLSKTPVIDAEGKITRLIGIFQDVTESKVS